MGERSNPDLLSYSKTAKALGVHRATVADLVQIYDLDTQPIPGLGNAKGLGSTARAKLRRLLDPSRVGRLAASA